MEIRFKKNYERTTKYVHTNLLLRNVWKLGSNKLMRERRRSFIQTCFREKCDFRFKQNYERTAKYVHTNVLLRKYGIQVQTKLSENGEGRSYKRLSRKCGK